MDGWLHTWFMIVHHINLAWCRLRGKLMEEVEERNEDGSCHEDQKFLFVIIVHVDFLFTVNHANDVEWIWWLQILCRRVKLDFSEAQLVKIWGCNWNGWIFCNHGDKKVCNKKCNISQNWGTPLFDNTAAACLPVVGGLIFCISATPQPGCLFPFFHGMVC